MSPALKYSFARVGIFVACAVPALLLLPDAIDPLLKLLIAVVVSAAASYFLLRRWRDEVADSLSAGARKRAEQRDRLRTALAGEDGEESAEADERR
jgi:Protein of unknown function (DUF4229)